MSDALEKIKAILPEHPAVQDLKPLDEEYAGLRILAVHAHPDDESSKGSATAAAYTSRGARYMVATMTGGERGDILNEEIRNAPRAHRDLPGLRRTEMARAAEILGIEHRWIGFMDSGLPEGDPLPPLSFGSFGTLPLEQAAAPLVRLVREYRPHIILSYDEVGGYPHPDHIMSHKVAVEAYEKAGDPEAYVGEGEPWKPLKLYYDRAFNPERTVALHEYLLDQRGESVFEGFTNIWRTVSMMRKTAPGTRPPREFSAVTTLSIAIRRFYRTPHRWIRKVFSLRSLPMSRSIFGPGRTIHLSTRGCR